MWLQLREFNSLRSPHLKGVRLMESRQSLKLDGAFDSLTPCHWPLAQFGSAPRSERGGSRFEAWAASQFFAGIVQRTGRNATNVQIEVRLLIPVPRFSTGRPTAQDTALRTLKLGLESPLVDQFSRWWPSGEAPDCRSGPDGFNSHSSRHGGVV